VKEMDIEQLLIERTDLVDSVLPALLVDINHP